MFYLEHLEDKLKNEITMVEARQKCTLFLFVVVGISIICMYPSELLLRYITIWNKDEHQNVYDAIYYLNWAGIYHHYIADPTF